MRAATYPFGLYTWFGYVRTFEEKMRLIGAAGFDTICTWWDDTFAELDGTRQEQVAMAAAHGLRIEHAHIPYLGSDKLWASGAAGDELVAEHMRSVALAAECGVSTLVIHPYETEKSDTDDPRWYHRRMRELGAVCRDCDVRLAIENLDGVHRLAQLVDPLVDENEHVGVCFDSGHANVSDPGDFCMLDHYGERVFALHLHDNDTTRDKHLVPFTPGCNLPWDAFMAALRKCGFAGSLMLESCAPFDFDAYDNVEGAGEVLDPDEPIETYLARSYEACARIAAACQGGVRGQVSDIA